MNQGKKSSLQYHNKKIETIYVISGIMQLKLEDKILELKPGDKITIHPLQTHKMRAQYSSLIYIECSTNDLEDVIRIEDDYGRN